MTNEFINLLPESRRTIVLRDYRMRLAVVATLFAAGLVLACMVLLAPTYVFLAGSQSIKEARLSHIKAMPVSADEKELSTRLAMLSSHAATLVALENSPTASKTMREVLAIPRTGIALTGIAYTPATSETKRNLVLSGVSTSRNALRSYQLALESMPSVLSATLPISAYAKDSNIPFTITMTFGP